MCHVAHFSSGISTANVGSFALLMLFAGLIFFLDPVR
jgi:hypothetical protein